MAFGLDRGMPGSSLVGFLASASLLMLLGSSPVSSASPCRPRPSDGVFCATGEEIEAAVGIYGQDLSGVLSRVNDRFGQQSCNVLTAVYLRSSEIRSVLVPEGIVHVLKVRLVGFESGAAWRKMPTSMEQYVAVFEKTTLV
jgi:hypothetical protein